MKPRAGSPAAGELSTSIIDSVAAFDRVSAEWSALLRTAAVTDELYHDPAVIRIALTADAGAVRPLMVAVRRGGTLCAVAPFYLQATRLPIRLSVVQLASVRLRALRLFGDRLIIQRDEDPRPVIEAVFRCLDGARRAFDVVWIHGQRLDDPFWAFLSSPDRPAAWKAIVTSGPGEKLHRLLFDGSWEAYLAGIRSKQGFPGKTIRRFWRDHGDRCRVRCITHADDVGRLLDGIDHVYNRSWQAGTYGARPRHTPEEAARLCAIAALGHLRSYLLVEDDTALAFVLGFQYRGRYLFEETAYDSGRSQTSPGSVVTFSAIEDLFRSDTPHELDFGFGDGAYKRTFGNTTSGICSLYLARSRRWRAILALQRHLTSGEAIARTLLTRVGLDARVRRLLKRRPPA